MNLPNIKPNLPCLQNVTYSNRHMSCSTNSKSIYSSSLTTSSNKSKDLNSIPILIQLCIHPNENYAYRTMRLLLSPRYHYSSNVCDEFGCNVLMYSLRYQRYRLFEFLLNEISLDLNLHTKDRYGNTILHYAILYSGNDIRFIEKLIEKYKKFAIEIDERNTFGFTPLLLAAFCGRYDLALALLTKTDASPFVRDHIQLKNIFDYIEIDMKHKECQNSQQSSYLNPESKRLSIQLHQTIPARQETSSQTNSNYTYKNFFELFLLRAIQDQSGLFRSLIIEIFSSNLTDLLNYLTQRYPRIKTARRLKDIPTTNVIIQQENSKIEVHNLLNLFDPQLKSKAIPPPPQIKIINTKTPITFKRLSIKLTTLNAFSRPNVDKKRPSLTATRIK